MRVACPEQPQPVAARSARARAGRRPAAVGLVCALLLGTAAPAGAQLLTFPQRPPPEVRQGPTTGQMLVQANEIQYDYANERVSAVGNVQIYFNNSTVEADRVTYDQKTKRLHAQGNVRLTEANGQVTYGEIMELTDDYRDGFVDSLRIELPEQTRIAAARGERTAGQFSVFQSGVYTACEPCKDDPKKPPKWQVKSARIIHDQTERMIYFEDARFELFGLPIAYFPYFSTPDPTVKRKTGFLIPSIGVTSRLGAFGRVPFFWAIAPDYDLTITPMMTTRQGPHLQLEWRQRLANGSYFIRGSGIHQWDPGAFTYRSGAPEPGAQSRWRGAVESGGLLSINDKWAWGWNLIAPSDIFYFRDYGISLPVQTTDPLRTTPTEGISDLFLSGRGNRSYFDARAIYFYGFSTADSQSRLPVVRPVVDYSYVFDAPVFDGELGYRTNLTSLSRASASMSPITMAAFMSGACAPWTADPAVKIPANCLLRGFPGTYTRFSAETHWRRSIIDSYGQVFTPFASLRADVATLSVVNDPGVANFLPVGDSSLARVMPTVGIEYRYPFIGVQSWGTHLIEPIAQVIVRPNETNIGRFPNEDAQSLVFDDTNLFKVDKFSGWDRVEGGGRANVGVQYTAQFHRAGQFNVLFGQSYHLFGTNSFAVRDLTNTGLDSGLDSRRSDYVARVAYRPNAMLGITSRFRFDRDSFDVRRFELETTASVSRWTVSLAYGRYDPQPALGFLTEREGFRGSARLKLTENWNLFGSLLYDIDQKKPVYASVGVGYVDDCLIVALNYMHTYLHTTGQHDNQTVLLQVQFRTIGGIGTSHVIARPDGA